VPTETSCYPPSLSWAIVVLIGLGLSVSGCGPASSSVSTSPGTLAAAVTAPATTAPVVAAPKPRPTKQTEPAVGKSRGYVELASWHLDGADRTCALMQTVYINRSNTPVQQITQGFRTLYVPRHNSSDHAGLVKGPVKTLIRRVSLGVNERISLNWTVCAPELRFTQNPAPPGTPKSKKPKIKARPANLTWIWTT
jgi:hypothetical protein